MRRRIPAAGVELDVLDEGERDRPVALLVHGFPDSSHLWRGQVPALLDAGLRVIAPDLRGFGASERPGRVEDYRVGRSIDDLVAVLDAPGGGRARGGGPRSGGGASGARG